MKVNGEEQLLENVDHFKYLGSVIDKDGTINRDVDLRVRAAWSSWRKLIGVLYDRKIPLRLKANYQTGSDVWERMLGNEGDQQAKDCYHGDEDASRDPRSVETRPHAKRGNPTHSTRFIHRRGLCPVAVFVGLDMSRDEIRCGQRHPQSDDPSGASRRGCPRKTWHQQIKDDMTGVSVTQDVALVLDRTE